MGTLIGSISGRPWIGGLGVAAFAVLGLATIWPEPPPDSRLPFPTSRLSGRTSVRVATIQYAPQFANPIANRRQLVPLIREAAEGGARIVVVPEAAITGYIAEDRSENWQRSGRPIAGEWQGKDPLKYAETVPGRSTREWSTLADELDIYLTIPFIEKADDRFFNTVCLAGPDGEIHAHYRKIHPYPDTESSWATPGDRGLQCVDTEFGRLAIAVCYDIHFLPEKYEAEQPWTLLFPTAWVDDEHPAPWFWHEMPKKAEKHGFHIVAANWSVREPRPWRGFGFSGVMLDTGQVAATAKSLIGSEVVFADLPTAPRR
ncbi:carbon-nitrogen hydrolase family protein [Haloferula helveola]|uniref:carbon-nitrogen hydrolase family protein n=1 Tax=Haloferula helveola TaxID=490095 RepID=UPI0030AA0812